jgi:bifunctional oligoribonuclease and PAP phosphatase NrnA
MMTSSPRPAAVRRIAEEVLRRRRFLITSHARPDGDAIGSQLALAQGLAALGKEVHIVNCDLAPPSLAWLPGAGDIVIARTAEGEFDAALVLECTDLTRPGIEGLDRCLIVNIDHHPGNTEYGAINWINERAAAVGEMVFDILEELDVRLTPGIAVNLYAAILTDTGGFHYSNVSPRTFDICRQLVEAGVDPAAVARAVYDANSLSRIRLLSSVLSTLELESSGRLAILYLDQEMLDRAAGTYDEIDGLINVPLTVKDIAAVVFFKVLEPGSCRVSMRSKGLIDVGRIAKEFGGGGHKNASGCTIEGSCSEVRPRVVSRLRQALETAPATVSTSPEPR